jgi:hypothetical protein
MRDLCREVVVTGATARAAEAVLRRLPAAEKRAAA